MPQICAALQFAHEAGVVHRDIKPENVLLDAKGRVKIADFGLAKLLGAAGPQHLTGTHQAMGTMHYMAPEQWEKPATVDHRADIYSLGVVFYELLTGELPLGRFAPPSEKVRIDVRLDQVVLRALEKEPERRYQRAGDVKTDVDRIAAKPSPTARPERESPPEGWSTSSVMAVCFIILSALAWPFGMIALPLVWWIARKRKRSMLSVVDEGVRFLGLHRAATWNPLVCLAGVANAFLPWVAVQSTGTTVHFFGFDARFSNYPVAITGGFVAMGFFFFVTAQLPRMRLWRACIALAGGATLVVLAAVFLHETYGIRYWNVNTAAAFGPKATREFYLVVFAGPFVAAGLAIGLMGLGAIDLRGYLVNRSSLAGSSNDANGITSPERPKEPPPLPDPLAANALPSFMFYVGWPVLAIVAVSSAAFATILTKPQGATLTKGVQEMVLGLGALGPIVGIVLFVRWLWMTLRPRHAAAFWVLTGVLAMIAVLGYGAAIVLSLMPIGSRPTMRRSDSPREQIIGTWGMAPSGARIEFKTGGTFAYWFREADPNSPGTIPPGAIEKPIYGRFAWMDDETMEFRSLGGSRMRLQFVDGTMTRSIEGAVIFLKIILDGPEFVVLNDGEAIARLRRIP